MPDDFDFNLDAKRVRITDNKMLESLKAFCADGSRPFTTSIYDAWQERVCSSQAISRRFGSWRKALEKAGFSYGSQAHTYTTLELIDNLEQVWREIGYPPGKRKLPKHGYRISERPYVNRWGSVAEACKVLKRYKDGEITESDLLPDDRPRSRRTIPMRLRWKILTRDNYQCVKCGKRPPEVKLEIDHIIPWSKEGTDCEDNLQTLCNICNSGKSDESTITY